ncbi:MAG: hypothetical protein ACFB20_01970 [Opitutales bacterium]
MAPTSWLLGAAFLLTLLVATPSTAQAGCFSYGYGGGFYGSALHRGYFGSSFGVRHHPFFRHRGAFGGVQRVYVVPRGYLRSYNRFPGYYYENPGESAIARSRAAAESARGGNQGTHVSSGGFSSRLNARSAYGREAPAEPPAEAQAISREDGRALLRQRFLAE